MNINLLPRKSRIQIIFWPVMLSVIILCAVITFIMVYVDIHIGSSIDKKHEQIVKLQTEVNSLRAIRRPDPLAGDFKDFQSDVNSLKHYRRDWIQILKLITTSLPTDSKILSYKFNGTGELEMDSQFANLQQVAEYLDILNRSASIESANAIRIARVQLANISDFTALTDLTTQVDNTTAETSKDDFIVNLEEKITPPQDESERILDELRWLMEQKTAKDQLGIIVPNVKIPASPDLESWTDSGLFTPEEIDSAKKEVDQYKEQNISPNETKIDEKKIYVYQTTLTIKMGALDVGKEVLP